MGFPNKGAKGLPGKRVDLYRAGITPIIFKLMPPQKIFF